MAMPPPFQNNQTISNATNNVLNIPTSFTSTTDQQQAVVVNAAAIAGMAAFGGFPPPNAPQPFLPYGKPNNSAPAPFLNTAPPPRFSNQSSALQSSQSSNSGTPNIVLNRNVCFYTIFLNK